MEKTGVSKLWGAAFELEPSEAVIAFTAGRDVAAKPAADAALLPYDLWVNKAHCVMLAKTGIIPVSDAAKILSELSALEKDKTFYLDPKKEDVHTNIESWLTAKIGIEIAGKLHTGRSRNDQIVTDMRLFMRDQVLGYVNNSVGLADTLIALADKYKSVLIPGFTHHQHAMVTTFGHVLAGFAAMILRDIERLTYWYGLHNASPLGAAAAYGTTFPIDRKLTAALLAFDGPDVNSVDAITNRWEPEADLGFAVTVLMNHMSAIAETIILFSMPEFGMITLSDEFCTGSSIMPQKKNPAPLEVVKGKAAYAAGQLVALLSLGKANFIGYNNDSQWAKYVIMDLLDECKYAPTVLAGTLSTMTVQSAMMDHWCHKGFIGTTTVMEQLISTQNIPMRQAKVLVEKAVKDAVGKDKVDYLDPAWQDPKMIIALTKSFGGPGKNSMKKAIKALKNMALHQKRWLLQKQKQKAAAKELLWKQIQTISK